LPQFRPIFEPGIVTAAALERELAGLYAAADPVAGIFGPGSTVWRIHRESALFLAAGRALLLQLAHPWVAAAVADHSHALSDPIGRFHRTFGLVFTMVFGATEDAIAAARRLHRRHAAISGVLGEKVGMFAAGSRYRANDLAALRWVFATLADSALAAFELVQPPLLDSEREQYYREMRRFAGFFGIPQTALPEDWPAFADYFAQSLASEAITAGGAGRRIAARLVDGGATGLHAPGWYRALTARLLPERLRAAFGLPYGAAERHAAERVVAALGFLYPRLPPLLRYVAPYREACARIAGRRPDAATRVLNRFWIGRSAIAGSLL
jgi:uncharacterized protein (DUF2236 family)